MSFERTMNWVFDRVFGRVSEDVPRIHLHSQNLNEKRVGGERVLGSMWKYGRAWLDFRTGTAWRSGFSLKGCWHFGSFSFRQTLSIDPSDHEITFAFAVPLVELYFTVCGIDWPWLWERTKRPGARYGTEREIGIRIFDWAIWWSLWEDEMESRGDDPWWMKGNFHPIDFLFGRREYKKEDLGEPKRIWIPLPEGEYLAEAQFTIARWWRPRWPWWPLRIERDYTDVNVLAWGGLPHEGKGENSWDCGTDGLFGYSSEGHNLEAAIAKGVESTLRDRRKYGGSRRGSYPKPIIDKVEGLKKFAERVAYCVKDEERHPKWPKSRVGLEPFQDGLVFIHHGRDSRPQTIVVTEEMAMKWHQVFAQALRSVKLKDDYQSEARS